MILGIVGNPPPRSESKELEAALLDLESALFAWDRSYDVEVRDAIRRAKRRITELRDQVRKGVHINPGHRAGGREMSHDVQAIIYTHIDDDRFYCHGFGNAEIDLVTRGNELRISGLKDRTGVKMIAQSDGSVRIVGDAGQHLWEDIR